MSDLPDPLPRKLNLGCGWDVRPGYLNVDFAPHHAPDLRADVTHLPMLPDGHFEEIVAQDVLEHFERGKTHIALQEWARLLSPTGYLWVRVPSLLHMADMLLEAESRGAEAAEKTIHLFYGTQAYTGDYHLAGFTASTLSKHLADAGLMVAAAILRDDWLFEVTATKQACAPVEWPLSRIGTTQQALIQRAAECKVAQQALDQCNAEYERVQQALAQRAAECEALYQSTSWRVTAPLRRLRGRR